MNKGLLISATLACAVALTAAGCCMGGGGGGGGGAAFSLAPGFQPDPTTATGSAGGIVDASSLNSECRGYVSITPSHVLTATGAFPNLRIAVNGGSADLTLVVRRPDGTYLCNDDSEGLNPMVEGPFAAGEHQIFVGTYSAESAGSSYRIGISELATTTPSTVGAP